MLRFWEGQIAGASGMTYTPATCTPPASPRLFIRKSEPHAAFDFDTKVVLHPTTRPGSAWILWQLSMENRVLSNPYATSFINLSFISFFVIGSCARHQSYGVLNFPSIQCPLQPHVRPPDNPFFRLVKCKKSACDDDGSPSIPQLLCRLRLNVPLDRLPCQSKRIEHRK